MFGFAMTDEGRDNFLNCLGKIHKIKSTTSPSLLLHMQIKEGEDNSLLLSQDNYIADILKRFGMENLRPKRVPLEKGYNILPCEHGESGCASSEEQELFRAEIGSLSYLARNARADLLSVVQQLSQYMHNPCKKHLEFCRNIFAYLLHTPHCALKYAGQTGVTPKLVGYTDANFPNTPDAKATIGCMWFLDYGSHRNLITWFSRKQRHVVDSTEEAELAGGSEGVKEGIALRGILSELGIMTEETPITLYMDNRAAVTVAQDGGYYPRLKHVNRKHKFLLEAVKEHHVQVYWCKGSEMIADALTKSLGGPELEEFRRLVFA
jgi:hypothetical protein